jgi:hypothetical protein
MRDWAKVGPTPSSARDPLVALLLRSLSILTKERPLVADKLLTEHPKRHAQRRTREFAVRDPVGDHLNGQFLSVADGFLTGGSVRHHARQLKSFSDPPAVDFAVESNGGWP